MCSANKLALVPNSNASFFGGHRPIMSVEGLCTGCERPYDPNYRKCVADDRLCKEVPGASEWCLCPECFNHDFKVALLENRLIEAGLSIVKCEDDGVFERMLVLDRETGEPIADVTEVV